MLNFIWSFIIIISVISSFFTDRVKELSNSIISSTSDSISLIISIIGMMALWTGLMKIAEKSGLTDILSKLFSPITRFLFPDISSTSKASKYICMNITANILGLGNAATPFGIQAMKELKKISNNSNHATNSMITFVVMNTASIQFIPTTLIILRQKYNSNNTFEVLPYLWIVSGIALVSGIIMTKIFEKLGEKHNKHK